MKHDIRFRVWVIAGALLASRLPVYAAPACDVVSEVTMEDGTLRTVRPRGDEFFNWTESSDGFAVARGENGRWQYARREPGRWVPSGMTPQQRGLEGRDFDPPARTSPFDSAGDTGASAPTTLSTEPLTPLATTPSPAKLLVILVSFADKSISTSASDWTNKFFGATGKTVNTFYKQTSKNRFWFNPAEETQGAVNDGVISVTLAINHPNESSPTTLTQSAVSAALTAADPYINYKAFDTDNNGYLSTSELHLVLIFAGYEYSYSSSYTPAIWAHRWSLTSPPLLDAVRVASSTGSGGYMAVGEYHDTHAATIGVICHELGHNLGLPDLYDTDNTSDGVGAHCLMGAGNWGLAPGDSYEGQTPALMGAYCRLAISFSDARVASGLGTAYTLIQVSDSTNTTDMVRINTPNNQQYFLVENRQLTGFDAGLYAYFSVSSGGGLAVWHIDTSAANNNTDARRLVDLEEAASPVLDTVGWPLGDIHNYYYAGNVTQFDATTSPNSALNGGGTSLASVYSVSASGATMTFTADEGTSLISLPSALDVEVGQVLTTGSPAWSWESTTTHDGADAAQSGAVSRTSRTSYMSTVVTGPVQVAFWWRNGSSSSSEQLRYLVDGVLQVAVTGSTTTASTWLQQSRNAGTGAHTVRWEMYTTRNSGTAGYAYVDQLSLTPLIAALAVDAPALSFPWTGGPAQIKVRNTGNASMNWRAVSAAWCSAAPTNGTLAAGSTQLVAMVCSTNRVRLVPRAGMLTVTGADTYGISATGSPAAAPISQGARAADPGMAFSIR